MARETTPVPYYWILFYEAYCPFNIVTRAVHPRLIICVEMLKCCRCSETEILFNFPFILQKFINDKQMDVYITLRKSQ